MRILLTILFFSASLAAIGQPDKLFVQDNFEKIDWINNWEGSEVPAGSFLQRSDSFRVSGSYSLRAESNKSGTLNRRAEALTSVEPAMNIERFYEFWLYIPNYYRRDSVDDIFFQLHEYPDFNLGEDYRSPPISLRIKKDSFYCVILSAAAQVNTNLTLDSNRSFNLGAVYRGTWMKWRLRAKLSYTNTGITQVWRNDSLKLDKTNYANYYNDVKGPYAKLGIYTPDWGSESSSSVVTQKVLYFDDFKASAGQLYGMEKVRVRINATQYRWALVKRPSNWDTNPDQQYVTVMDNHGSGEIGSGEAGLTALGDQGLPYLVKKGSIPDSFYNFRTGKYQKILYIFIQHQVSGSPMSVASMVYARENTAFFKDRIDPKNIFYSGLSLGARGASGFFVDGQEAELAKIRGFILMSSPEPTGTETLTQPGGIVERKIPIYLLWNLADNQAPSIQPWNKKVRDTLNKYNARQVSWVNYTSSPAHGGWITQWNPSTRRSVTFMDGVTLNVNLFEWILYNSDIGSASADAGDDKNITLPTNFVTLYGQAQGTSSEWAQITGPNTASINSPFNDTTTVTGLIEGIYTFRLRAYNGDDFVDDMVTVTVNPEPVIPPDPPDTLPPGIGAVKPGKNKWVTYRPNTTPPVEDTVVARVFFSRNALTQFGWKNIPFSPGPHSAVVTGFDSLTWRKITFSTMSTSRWVKPVGGSYTAAATGLGENVADTSFYFPATTLTSCFYSAATRAPGDHMMEIGNLEQGVKYMLEIMASHNDDDASITTPTRECYYVLTDNAGSETSANYNVKGNTRRVIVFTNKYADINGKIYLIVNPVATHPYGYLAAIRITKLKP